MEKLSNLTNYNNLDVILDGVVTDSTLFKFEKVFSLQVIS